ncbi:MAG: histidinol-phosphate transaminase [Oscillospiraceae bacterium]|nr:histidinol-phosphate transaminase [Oscillospiraceae bacterium]
MSSFFSKRHSQLEPYTPGEQPQDRSYIKLNTNESPFPPSPGVSAAAEKEAGRLQLYSDPESRELIRALADRYRLSTDELIVGNGSDELLNFAFMAWCDETHPALFPDISYGFYPVFAQLNRIPYEEIPLKEDFSICLDDYHSRKGTVFLANPNAPTGLLKSCAEIERLLRSDPNRVVVVDEAYIDFAAGPDGGSASMLSRIRDHENLLVIQTFSKSRSLAGGRLGFAAGNPALIRDLNTLKYSTNPYNVNRMTAAAGIAALREDEYYCENAGKIVRTRTETAAALRGLGFTVTDSQSNFLFARSDRVPGETLYRELKARGILVRHFGKDRIRDFLRITVGSDMQMQALLRELEQILGEHGEEKQTGR